MQAQQAKRLGKHVLSDTQKAVPYAKLASTSAAADDPLAKALLDGQPELVHLERCLGEHMAREGYGSVATPSNRDTVPPLTAGSQAIPCRCLMHFEKRKLDPFVILDMQHTHDLAIWHLQRYLYFAERSQAQPIPW